MKREPLQLRVNPAIKTCLQGVAFAERKTLSDVVTEALELYLVEKRWLTEEELQRTLMTGELPKHTTKSKRK